MRVIRPPAITLNALTRGIEDFFAYRELLYALSSHRIRVRYKQSALGVAWAVIQPVSLMLIYTLIFNVFTRIPSNGKPYAVFVFAALLPWTFFAGAVTTAGNSLVGHQQLITKVFFPREILPITYVIAGLFDLAIGSGVLMLLMLYYEMPLRLSALWAVPLIGIATILALGVGFFLSAVQVRFRDIGLAMPLVMQVWMFATPVIYPFSSVPERFRSLYTLNPMVGVVENFRRVLVEGTAPDLWLMGQSGGLAALALVFGYVYLKGREALMADVI